MRRLWVYLAEVGAMVSLAVLGVILLPDAIPTMVISMGAVFIVLLGRWSIWEKRRG